LSFFDEADEPRTAQHSTPRGGRRAGSSRRPAGGRGRRPSRGGRRPPDRQAIQIRRAVAFVGIVIVVILIVLGVHSCQVSQRNSALKDYNNNVASLDQQSDDTGSQLFKLLSSGVGATNATGLQSQINEAAVAANNQLTRAQNMNIPGEVKTAQQNLLLALRMRRDGIANIAAQIQPALSSSSSQDAINLIAAEMARLYASDVVYKDYTLPLISGALNSAGIPVGGVTGETFNNGQFLPDLQWLTPSYVAAQLRSSTPTSQGKPAPGVHGHRLDSCSVGGNTLQTGSTNTVPASPPPTFSCLFTNDGQNTEHNVVVKVSVSGTSVTGQAIVPQTTPGQQATAQITLGSSPSAGSYRVTATVERVPGETTTTHNTQIYPVTFQ
jgi:hypothetical protein